MRSFIAGAAVVAASQAAWAADLEVGKGRPYANIQEAIDAAAPGDRILVRPGVYREPVSIPSGKDGLQLVGKRAVIDGHRDDGSSSYTVEVDSNDVVVEGFTIRNGSSYSVEVEADRVTIRKCRIRNADEYGLYVSGDDILAEDVDLLGGGYRAVEVYGSRAALRGLRARGWGEGGIYVRGDDAIVEDTDLRVIEDDDGIKIDGAGPQVRRCTVSGVDDEGILLSGDGAVVDACGVRASSNYGIRAEGPRVTVTGCTVRGCSSTGIRANGTVALVSGNTVSRVGEGNTGISVTVSATDSIEISAVLEDNVVTDVVGWGFYVYSESAATLRRNRAERTGDGRRGGGFEVRAMSFLLQDCTSLLAGDTAFLVATRADTGSRSLQRCIAEDAVGDGFQIAASWTAVDACEARRCDGEGLHNAAASVTVTGCVLRGNRIDLANETSNGASFANDVAADDDYGTGGPDTEPQIDFSPIL